MPGALRGVSKLLADVGEQIGEIMPDQSLYRGQTLEIIAEVLFYFLCKSYIRLAQCFFQKLQEALNLVHLFYWTTGASSTASSFLLLFTVETSGASVQGNSAF